MASQLTKRVLKRIVIALSTMALVVPLNMGWDTSAESTLDSDNDGYPDGVDIDPYTDLQLTVAVFGWNQLVKLDRSSLTDGDFWYAIIVEDQIYYSKDDPDPGFLPGKIWTDRGFIISPQAWVDAPIFQVRDDFPTVQVMIILYDNDGSASNFVCDIDSTPGIGTAGLTYDLRTGDWTGDGEMTSLGIGHTSGALDGTTSSAQGDCELWFYIVQNDNDQDGWTYTEEVMYASSRSLDPTSCDFEDTDGDGVGNYVEYLSHSKSDMPDTDLDGIYDRYELMFSSLGNKFQWKGNAYSLSPTLCWDENPYIDCLRGNISRMMDPSNQYRYLFNWQWLKDNPVYAANYYYDLMKYYDSGQTEQEKWWTILLDPVDIAELVAEYLVDPAPIFTWVDIVANWEFALIQYLLVEFARDVLSSAFSIWSKIDIMWSGFAFNGPSVWQEDAGVARQIGYGLYGCSQAGGQNWIPSHFGLIHDDCVALVGMMSDSGQRNFNSEILPALTDMRTHFGYTYDSDNKLPPGGTPLNPGIETIPVRTSTGSIEQVYFIDDSTPASEKTASFRYYSDLELYLYQMARAIRQGWYGHTIVLDSASGKKVTTGDVAQDLLNMIYEAFLTVKEWNLILNSVIYPSVDVTPPSCSVDVNPSGLINTQDVILTLSASDNMGVSQMRISNDDVWEDPSNPSSFWMPFVPGERAWTLEGPNGVKRVCFQVKDIAGNIGWDSHEVFLDIGPPSQPGVPAWAPDDELDGIVTLTWTISHDDSSGIDHYLLQESVDDGLTWTYPGVLVPGNTNSYTTSPMSPGTHYFRVCAVDGAGNSGPYSSSSLPCNVPVSAPGTPTWIGNDERDGSYRLTWTATANAVRYELQEMVLGGSWTTLSDQIVSTYYDLPYRSPGTYYYQVRAWDGDNQNGPWSEVSAACVVPWDVLLDSTSSSASRPSIAVDAQGSYHIAYIANVNGNDEILCAEYDENWNHVETYQLSAPLGTGYSHTSVSPSVDMGPDGSLYVVWSDNKYGFYQILYRRQNPTGTWDGEMILTRTSVDHKAPDVAVDSLGKLHVVFRTVDIDSGTGTVTEEMVYFNTLEGGVALFTCTDVYQAGASKDHIESPRIAVGSDGVLHVVFSLGGQYPVEVGPSQILYLRCSGGQWDDAVQIGWLTNAPWSVSLDADSDGHVIAAYEDWGATGGAFNVWVLRSSDNGFNWFNRKAVAGAKAYETVPDICFGSGGRVYVVWSVGGVGDYSYEISGAISSDYGYSWGPHPSISNAYGLSSLPAIAVSSSGKLGVAWIDGRSGSLEVYFAAKYFKDSIPEPYPNQAPVAMSTVTPSDLTVSVDGSASYDPEGWSLWFYAWEWGDGTWTASLEATAVHTYASPGIYTVRLTVTDRIGATGTLSQQVTVTAPASILWSDDFEDHGLDPWVGTVTAGSINVVDVRDTSSSPDPGTWSLHIGKADRGAAAATSQAISLWDTSRDYTLKLSFYLATTSSAVVTVIDDGRLSIIAMMESGGTTATLYSGTMDYICEITMDCWHSIEIRAYSGLYDVLVDGIPVPDGTGLFMEDPSSTSNQLMVGSDGGRRNTFDAYWDDFSIFGYAKP